MTIRSHALTSASHTVSVHLSRCNTFAGGRCPLWHVSGQKASLGGCPCPSFANRGGYAITAAGGKRISPVVVMRAMQGKFGPLSFSLSLSSPPYFLSRPTPTDGMQHFQYSQCDDLREECFVPCNRDQVASVRSIDSIRESLVTV